MIARNCPSCGFRITTRVLLSKKGGDPFPCPSCGKLVAVILVGPLVSQALADASKDWAFANGRGNNVRK